jgi:hypothetical protein
MANYLGLDAWIEEHLLGELVDLPNETVVPLVI